jgi:hypothetical protein
MSAKLPRVERLLRAREIERQIAAGDAHAASATVSQAAQAAEQSAQALREHDRATTQHLHGEIGVQDLDAFERTRLGSHHAKTRATADLDRATQAHALSVSELRAAEVRRRQSETLADNLRSDLGQREERKLQTALDDFSLRKGRA